MATYIMSMSFALLHTRMENVGDGARAARATRATTAGTTTARTTTARTTARARATGRRTSAAGAARLGRLRKSGAHQRYAGDTREQPRSQPETMSN